MPRDPRPYLTYPVGYSTHPRWELLSDGAFRALHEMQDYSRSLLTDGRVDCRVADRRWKRRFLDEILAGIDDRPLMILDGDTYVIRSYADHQMTAADVEDLRQKRSDAGRKGGIARASATALAKQSSSREEVREEVGEKKDANLTVRLPDADASAADELGFRSATGRQSFDELWALWPSSRRGTRKKVASALRSAVKVVGVRNVELILAAARDHVAVWVTWPEADQTFVPELTTWLNQERWTAAAPMPRQARPEPKPEPVRAPMRNVTAERLAREAAELEALEAGAS